MNQLISGVLGWHWTQPSSFLLHNVFLGKGHTPSASLMAAAHSGFVSNYQVLNRQPDKEALWERVRAEIAPALPSRLGAFFMFEDLETAERGRQRWFSTASLIAVRAVALAPRSATLHRGDTAWLDLPETEWREAAIRYWQGTASQAPLFEMLVHGQIFFPDWETPPFGLLYAVPGQIS